MVTSGLQTDDLVESFYLPKIPPFSPPDFLLPHILTCTQSIVNKPTWDCCITNLF